MRAGFDTISYHTTPYLEIALSHRLTHLLLLLLLLLLIRRILRIHLLMLELLLLHGINSCTDSEMGVPLLVETVERGSRRAVRRVLLLLLHHLSAGAELRWVAISLLRPHG